MKVEEVRKYYEESEEHSKVKDEYLRVRGVLEAANKLGVRYRQEGNENLIVFPIEDIRGKITGVEIKSIEKEHYDKKYSELAKVSFSSFGLGKMVQRIYEKESVILVEGSFDFLSVASAIDYPVIPVLEKRISSLCKSFLRRFTKEVILFMDRGADLQWLRDDLAKYLMIVVVDWQKNEVLKRLQDCKDANDILVKKGPKFLSSVFSVASTVI